MPAIPASSISTQAPRYGTNGLLTGYEDINAATGSPANRYGAVQPGAGERPIWGPNGVLIGSVSGQPYSGVYNGVHVKNGVQLQLDPVTGNYMTPDEIAQSNAKIQNDPNARYKPVDIPKNPDIAQATSSLVDDFKKTADQSLKDFSDYLTNFKSDVASARAAGKAATDPTETINRLNAANTGYNSELDTANNKYQGALDQGQAAENAIVKQAQNELPQYDAAAQNVADRQQQALVQNLSRYKLGSGTPTSLGGDEEQMLLQGVKDIQLPTQLAKIQRQYDVYGNYALPVARDITGQNIGYAGSFLPSVAGSRYGANTGTANNIQNIRMQVANMSFDDATRYMASLGIPWQLQSQILSGNISNLGGLNALESGSRYQGLQDVMGVNVTQPQGYSFAAPGAPSYVPGNYPITSRYNTNVNPPKNTASSVAAPPGGNPTNSAYLNSLIADPTATLFKSQNPSLISPVSDYYDSVGTGDGSYFA